MPVSSLSANLNVLDSKLSPSSFLTFIIGVGVSLVCFPKLQRVRVVCLSFQAESFVFTPMLEIYSKKPIYVITMACFTLLQVCYALAPCSLFTFPFELASSS